MFIINFAKKAITIPIIGLYAELLLFETKYIARAKSGTCKIGYIINVNIELSIASVLADVSIIVLMLNKPVIQFIMADNAKMPKTICTIIFDFSFLCKDKTYISHATLGIR